MGLIESVKDLQRIRAEKNQEIEAGKIGKQRRLILGLGTAGVASGARDTLKAMLAFIKENKVDRIIIKHTGDIGLDSFEPILRVEVPGQDPIAYSNVTPEKAVEIIQAHVMNGRVLENYILNGQIDR